MARDRVCQARRPSRCCPRGTASGRPSPSSTQVRFTPRSAARPRVAVATAPGRPFTAGRPNCLSHSRSAVTNGLAQSPSTGIAPRAGRAVQWAVRAADAARPPRA
jgi:hypothetical protein